MSYIAQLRQRIKVIQTIQKTTSAMRLIAMSLQGRLHKKHAFLKAYRASIEAALAQYSAMYQSAESEHTSSQISETSHITAPKTLYIIVASQKGLCGSFNEHLFTYFKHHHRLSAQDRIITVGTYATKFIINEHHKPEASFNQFSIATFVAIAQQLTNLILRTGAIHTIVFHHVPKSFFIQQPHTTEIHSSPSSHHAGEKASLHAHLERMKLHATITQLLYESLLSEQAARFLSMDGATRNAEHLLTQTRLAYNKSRQAAITRELIELTSGFSNTQ